MRIEKTIGDKLISKSRFYNSSIILDMRDRLGIGRLRFGLCLEYRLLEMERKQIL